MKKAVLVGLCVIVGAGLLVLWAIWGRSEPLPKLASDSSGVFVADGPTNRREIPSAREMPRAGVAVPTTPKSLEDIGSPSVRVSGEVLEATTRNPIDGATIALARSIPGGAIEYVPVAVSDAAGRFRCEVAGEPYSVHSALVAVKEGYARSSLRRSDRPDRRSRPEFEATFLLEFGGEIAGRVIDSDGAPIVGARVGRHELGGWRPAEDAVPSEQRPRWSAMAVTDADGAFLLDCLPTGETFRLPVVARGFMRGVSEPVAVGTRDVVVVLERGQASIHGLVTDHRDRPVENVLVALMPALPPDSSPTPEARASARVELTGTDASGRYEFTGLAAGSYHVLCGSSAAQVRGLSSLQPLVLAAGDDAESNHQLPATVLVEIRAFDAESGMGVQGVQLQMSGLSQFRFDATRAPWPTQLATDVSGRAQAEAFPNSIAQVVVPYVLPAGWVEASTSSSGILAIDGIQNGGVAQGELPLMRGATLLGRVLAPPGQPPAAGAIVSLHSRLVRSMLIVTDGDGRFRASVPAQADVAVRVSWNGAGGNRNVTSGPVGSTTEIEIQLKSSGSVSGRVTAEGKPLEGIQVSVRNLTGLQGTHFFDSKGTDADGRYRVGGIPPGEVLVNVTVPPALLFEAPKELRLQVPEGAVVPDVDFDLVRGLVIEGVVSNEDGEAIEGARVDAVIVMPNGGIETGRFHATSDAEGYYAIGGFFAGQSIRGVQAQAEGYFLETHRLESERVEGPYNFTLIRKDEVRLAVYASSPSAPVPRFQYRVLHHRSPGNSYTIPAEVAWSEANDPSGRTRLEPQGGEGRFRVEVMELDATGATTGRRGMADFSHNPHLATPTVQVDVGVDRTVTGKVQTPSGRGLENVSVGLSLPMTLFFGAEHVEKAFLQTQTDKNGAFEIHAVPPGEYGIGATGQGIMEYRNITVPLAGPTPAVEFVVPDSGSIEVQVMVSSPTEAGFPATLAYRLEPVRTTPESRTVNGRIDVNEWGYGTIEEAPFGLYRGVVTMPNGQRAESSHAVRIEPSSPRGSLTFNLREPVVVTGRIRLNNRPWDGTPELVLAWHYNDTARLENLGDGRYRATVHRTDQRLCSLFLVHLHQNLSSQQFEIPPGVTEFERDFDLKLGDVSVVVVFPDGEQPRLGRVRTHFQLSSRDSVPIFPDRPTALVPDLVPGMYSFSYESEDRLWKGRRERVEVRADGTDVVEIEAVPNESNWTVGRWDSSRMGDGTTQLEFDASRWAHGETSFRLLAIHEVGDGHVEITRVAVLVDGLEIAVFTGSFVVGGHRPEARMDFQYPGPTPPTGGVWKVTFRIERRGEGHSRGMIVAER